MGETEHACWDDSKNERNIEARPIDFASLEPAFDGHFALVVEDKRHDYGEQRFNMLVELNGIVLHITFTLRPPRYRIISARMASRKERNVYHARQQAP